MDLKTLTQGMTGEDAIRYGLLVTGGAFLGGPVGIAAGVGLGAATQVAQAQEAKRRARKAAEAAAEPVLVTDFEEAE